MQSVDTFLSVHLTHNKACPSISITKTQQQNSVYECFLSQFMNFYML